jgi:hypothetical protein
MIQLIIFLFWTFGFEQLGDKLNVSRKLRYHRNFPGFSCDAG